MLCFIYAQPSFAQGVYLQPNGAPAAGVLQNDSPSANEEIDDMLGLGTSKGAPKTIKDYTNLHYQNCLKTEHPVLTGSSLEFMCRCTTPKFMEAMTLEQIKEIEKGSTEGEFQLSRMLLFVYSPCVKPTLYTMIKRSCITNPKTKYLMKNPTVTCGCLAEGVSSNIAENASYYMRSFLSNPKQRFDPIGFLIPQKEYERETNHHSSTCIEWHERR